MLHTVSYIPMIGIFQGRRGRVSAAAVLPCVLFWCDWCDSHHSRRYPGFLKGSMSGMRDCVLSQLIDCKYVQHCSRATHGEVHSKHLPLHLLAVLCVLVQVSWQCAGDGHVQLTRIRHMFKPSLAFIIIS
jgi:hypothetical protein